MRVVEVNRESVQLHNGEGECRARALPRLLRAPRVDYPPKVGDAAR